MIIAWGNSHQTSKVVRQAKMEILNRLANAKWKLTAYPHEKVMKALIKEGRENQGDSQKNLRVVKKKTAEA